MKKHPVPYKIVQPGWYAIVALEGHGDVPARGPYQNAAQIRAAVARWHRRAPYAQDLHACEPEVLGPYANRAAARRAQKGDHVDHQPLLPAKGEFISSRNDGGGHWPRGKPRHNVQAPEGYDTLEEFLAAVRQHCQEHRLGRQLAQELGVSAMTVSRWLRGQDTPPQKALNRMKFWMALQLTAVRG